VLAEWIIALSGVFVAVDNTSQQPVITQECVVWCCQFVPHGVDQTFTMICLNTSALWFLQNLVTLKGLVILLRKYYKLTAYILNANLSSVVFEWIRTDTTGMNYCERASPFHVAT
jgi:hypothetical protein